MREYKCILCLVINKNKRDSSIVISLDPVTIRVRR